MSDPRATGRSREDFTRLVRDMVLGLRTNPDRWENVTLEDYLSALTAWAEDLDGYYENRGEPAPREASWKLLGEMLLAARVYE